MYELQVPSFASVPEILWPPQIMDSPLTVLLVPRYHTFQGWEHILSVTAQYREAVEQLKARVSGQYSAGTIFVVQSPLAVQSCLHIWSKEVWPELYRYVNMNPVNLQSHPAHEPMNPLNHHPYPSKTHTQTQ